MAAEGEFTKNLNLSNQNPYVDADGELTWSNQQGRILDNGFRDSANWGGPSCFIYAGPVDRAKTIRSIVEIGESGSMWSNPRGPMLLVPDGADKGKGYWARINGSEIQIQRMDTANAGTVVNLGTKATGVSFTSGDTVSIEITPAGAITCRHNGVAVTTANDSTYVAEVNPGGGVEDQNGNQTRIVTFAADGIVAEAGGAEWNGAPNPPDATEGVPYSYDFSGLIDGDDPKTASSVGAALSPGLAVVDLTIAGTPSAGEVTTGHVLNAVNAKGNQDSPTFDMTVHAAGQAPTVSNINGDDRIQSLENCLVAGLDLDTVTEVKIGAEDIPFIIVNPTNLAFECPDIHLLPYRAGEQCPVTFFNEHGSTNHQVTLVEIAGNTTIQATAIETDPAKPGLFHSVPGAQVGDSYEGQLSIGGSAATYETDGPHRDLQPLVPAGTLSTGFHFGAVSKVWTQINEVTNPPAGPIVLSDINVQNSDNIVGTEVNSSDVAGNGFVSLRTDRQWLDSDIPDIIAGTVGGPVVDHMMVTGALHMTALFPGQAYETQHYVAWVQDSGDGRVSNMVTGHVITGGAPAVPATLDNPYTGLVGGAFGSVGCDSNLARGTLHLACYLTSGEPTPDTIKSGAGSAAFTRVGVYKTGKQGPYALVGLAENTLYYYWLVQDSDGNGMYSNVVGGTFTTTAGPSPLPDDLIGTKSDTMANALKLQGFTGSVNDMLLAWAKSIGGTGNQLNDVLLSALKKQTGGTTSKQLSDAWFNVLRAHGFTGARSEMEHAFWAAGGAFVEDPAAPPPDPELPGSLEDLVQSLIEEGWDAVLFPPDAIKVDDFDGWVTIQETEIADGSFLYRTDISNPLKADIQQWIDGG